MKKRLHYSWSLLLSLTAGLTLACSGNGSSATQEKSIPEKPTYDSRYQETATLAGGCFWCIEAPLQELEGVLEVVSGYTGGKEKNPSYEQVASGQTGHYEAVQVTFDPEVISYAELLDVFWQQFDPTDAGGSFADRGPQYRSAIFYHDKKQQAVAEASRDRLAASGIFDSPIVTPIEKVGKFYPAEAYHQDYYKKNPDEYYAYRRGSGREAFIKKHWGKFEAARYPRPDEKQIKAMLTDLQYRVTMHEETERAFANPYDSNKEAGIYVCIVSGAPLFSSSDKFDSGTGWPSFTKPIDARLIHKPIDRSYGMVRVEVRSAPGDSHVGHVFYDGPNPTNLRYCMNSAAMRFIPRDKMEEAGYGDFLWLVAEK